MSQESNSAAQSSETDAKSLQLRARIRDAAQQYVAQSLVQPLLKQAREMRDDTPPFGATQAEGQFGSMLDERTALDMVQRGRWGIVRNIEHRLLRAAGLESTANVAAVTQTPKVSSPVTGGMP